MKVQWIRHRGWVQLRQDKLTEIFIQGNQLTREQDLPSACKGSYWCNPAGDCPAANLSHGCAWWSKLPWTRAGLWSLRWIPVPDKFLGTWDECCLNFLHVEVLPALCAVLLPCAPCAKERGEGARHHQVSWRVGRKIASRANHAAVAELWASCSTGKVVGRIFVGALRLKY